VLSSPVVDSAVLDSPVVMVLIRAGLAPGTP
jgi:hypothetical protein